MMKIEIDRNKLTDAIYQKKFDDQFLFDEESMDELINDLRGNPTCFLISGYRGSGKSSFLKKIEEKLENNQTKNKDSSNDIVFVQTNFSRYQSQKFLLRKLIRNLYLEISDSGKLKDLESKEKEDKTSLENSAFNLLTSLYERTFFEITSQNKTTLKEEKTWKLEVDIKKIIIQFLPLIGIFGYSSLSIFNLIFPSKIFDHLLILFLILWQGLNIRSSYLRQKTNIDEFHRKSLYDDEIADYHFFNLLKKLKDNFKIVFVLDELDKVEPEDLEKLIKEMKPYLVSGYASFIVVAGQGSISIITFHIQRMMIFFQVYFRE